MPDQAWVTGEAVLFACVVPVKYELVRTFNSQRACDRTRSGFSISRDELFEDVLFFGSRRKLERDPFFRPTNCGGTRTRSREDGTRNRLPRHLNFSVTNLVKVEVGNYRNVIGDERLNGPGFLNFCTIGTAHENVIDSFRDLVGGITEPSVFVLYHSPGITKTR